MECPRCRRVVEACCEGVPSYCLVDSVGIAAAYKGDMVAITAANASRKTRPS